MPRVNYVKKARKDNPVCKRGESYYWWKFRYGGKHYSLTRPKPSQLTQSDFLSWAYGLFDTDIPGQVFENSSDIVSFLDELISGIDERYDLSSESLDNIPYQLQEGMAGTLLQERIDWLDELRGEVENIQSGDEMETLRVLEEQLEELGEGWDMGDLKIEIESAIEEIKGLLESLPEYDGG